MNSSNHTRASLLNRPGGESHILSGLPEEVIVLLFQNIVCSMIVFMAYAKLGYYRPWSVFTAMHAYFSEKQRLKSEVLMVTRLGLPVGSLMCSVDRGWLPIDIAFPKEMKALRQKYAGRLGYFGKFAVIPALQGKLVGKALMRESVTSWSVRNRVDVAVMMVNPLHVSMYRRFGAEVIARTNGTKGMEKAPAVLMALDYHKSSTIMRLISEYIKNQIDYPLEVIN